MGQAGGYHPGAALADHLEKIHVGHAVRVGEVLVTESQSSRATASYAPERISSETSSAEALDTWAVPTRVKVVP